MKASADFPQLLSALTFAPADQAKPTTIGDRDLPKQGELKSDSSNAFHGGPVVLWNSEPVQEHPSELQAPKLEESPKLPARSELLQTRSPRKSKTMIGAAVDAPTPHKNGHSAKSAKAPTDPPAKPAERAVRSVEVFAIPVVPCTALQPSDLSLSLPVSGTDNSEPDLHEKTSASPDIAAAPAGRTDASMAPAGKLAFGLHLSAVENLTPIPNPQVSAPVTPLNKADAALNIDDAKGLDCQEPPPVLAIDGGQAPDPSHTMPEPRFNIDWSRSPLPSSATEETPEPARPMLPSRPDNVTQSEEIARTAPPPTEWRPRIPHTFSQPTVPPADRESAPVIVAPSTGGDFVGNWRKAQPAPAARPLVFTSSSPLLPAVPVSAKEPEPGHDNTSEAAPVDSGSRQISSRIVRARQMGEAMPPKSVPPRPDVTSAASGMALPRKQNPRDAGPGAIPAIVTSGNKDIAELAARPPIDAGISATRQEPASSPSPEHTPAAPVAASSPVEAKTSSLPLRPAREVLLRVKSEDSQNVNVQLRQRGAGVEIAVRSDNPGLAKALQSDLGELVGRLENHGFKTQAWTPADARHLNVVQAGASAANEERPFGSGRHHDPQEQRDPQQRKHDSSERRPAPGAAAWAAAWNNTLSLEDGKVL